MRTLVRVNSESVCEKGETIASLGYVEGQAIQAKVTKLLEDKKSVYLDCRKKRVYRGDLEVCYNFTFFFFPPSSPCCFVFLLYVTFCFRLA